MKKNYSLFFAFLALLTFVNPASANADAALLAYQAEQFNRAFRLLKIPADQGHPQSQYLLSTLYLRGLGVKRNKVQALKLLRKSAKGGYADAQFTLGNNYFHGVAVGRNFPTAIHWWVLAANQGQMKAQFNLGFAYLRGSGIDKNLTLAQSWFEKAAISGSLSASRMLDELGANQMQKVQIKHLVKQPVVAEELQPDLVASFPRPASDTPPANTHRQASLTPSRSLKIQPTSSDSSSIATNESAKNLSRSVPGEASTAPSTKAQFPTQYIASQPEPTQARQPEPASQIPQQTGSLLLANWFQSRPPEHYTIQVYLHVDKQNAMDFAQQIGKNRTVGMFASRRKGKKTWGIVVGEYANQQAAQIARQNLPLDEWNRPGWFHSFAEIQQIMITE